MQWPADGQYGDAKTIREWVRAQGGSARTDFLNGLVIETLEDDMTVMPGDFVIRGVHGEFYPCKPDIFAASYEAVAE
jgi:hypothetical protein